MAELATIFTAMEKGPEAIWANDHAINAQLEADQVRYIAPQKAITTNVVAATNVPMFWREGHTVHISGIASSVPSDASINWWTIPVGFRPDVDNMFVLPHNANPAQFAIIYFRANGKTNTVYNSKVADSQVVFNGVTWITDDDFPD